MHQKKKKKKFYLFSFLLILCHFITYFPIFQLSFFVSALMCWISKSSLLFSDFLCHILLFLSLLDAVSSFLPVAFSCLLVLSSLHSVLEAFLPCLIALSCLFRFESNALRNEHKLWILGCGFWIMSFTVGWLGWEHLQGNIWYQHYQFFPLGLIRFSTKGYFELLLERYGLGVLWQPEKEGGRCSACSIPIILLFSVCSSAPDCAWLSPIHVQFLSFFPGEKRFQTSWAGEEVAAQRCVMAVRIYLFVYLLEFIICQVLGIYTLQTLAYKEGKSVNTPFFRCRN